MIKKILHILFLVLYLGGTFQVVTIDSFELAEISESYLGQEGKVLKNSCKEEVETKEVYVKNNLVVVNTISLYYMREFNNKSFDKLMVLYDIYC